MFNLETCHFELHDIQAVAKGAPAGSRATAVPFASLTQSKTAADRQGNYSLFRTPHLCITKSDFLLQVDCVQRRPATGNSWSQSKHVACEQCLGGSSAHCHSESLTVVGAQRAVYAELSMAAPGGWSSSRRNIPQCHSSSGTAAVASNDRRINCGDAQHFRHSSCDTSTQPSTSSSSSNRRQRLDWLVERQWLECAACWSAEGY